MFSEPGHLSPNIAFGSGSPACPVAALPALLSQASSLSVPDGICLVYLTLFQTQGQAPGQPLSTAATWKSVL